MRLRKGEPALDCSLRLTLQCRRVVRFVEIKAVFAICVIHQLDGCVSGKRMVDEGVNRGIQG